MQDRWYWDKVTSYKRDDQDRVIEAIGDDGSVVYRHVYLPDGQATMITDDSDHVYCFRTDKSGRLHHDVDQSLFE